MTTIQENVNETRRTSVILSVVLALLSWGFTSTNLSAMVQLVQILKEDT